MRKMAGPDGSMWYASYNIPKFTHLTRKHGITVNHMGSHFFCLAHCKSVKGLEPGATTSTAVEPGQGPISYMTKDSCTWSLNYSESKRYYAKRSIRADCGSSECVFDFLHLVDTIERDAERMPLRPLLRTDFADAVTMQCQVPLTPGLR